MLASPYCAMAARRGLPSLGSTSCRASSFSPLPLCAISPDALKSRLGGARKEQFGRIRGLAMSPSAGHRRQMPALKTVASAASTNGASVDTKIATITTPLYYVNASPHMGSAYPTIAADALARFCRLQGHPTAFVTGTDEHGEKIAAAAHKANRAPQEHCDAVAQDYLALWSKLNISMDRFSRTTNPNHEKVVLEFFERVYERGDIYRAQYAGNYCVACEEYKDVADMLEGNVCPVHRTVCPHREENNFFFKLTNYQAALEELLESNPDFVQPASRRNEVLGWVKSGVRDFSISRAAVAWGIPVPKDPSQTIYVWFDALLGYISCLLAPGDEVTLNNAVARGWPAHVHIIGKDILRFHAVYWPAMLMSAGLPLPKKVYGHGFLTKDGLKMGKSLGNVLDPVELVDKYGADAVRFFLLGGVDFGSDGDFSYERFINIVNAALANNLGNLLNRSVNLLNKNCAGTVAGDAGGLAADHPLRVLAASKVPVAADAYGKLHFDKACEAALAISAAGNHYLEERAPWSKFKKGTEEEKKAAAMDLVAVLEAVRIVAVILSPVTPTLVQKMYRQLGFSEEQFAGLQWVCLASRAS
eukprot:jgi/Mesvir1/26840/Mv20593-RA.2